MTCFIKDGMDFVSESADVMYRDNLNYPSAYTWFCTLHTLTHVFLPALGLVHALLLVAVVARTFSKSCEPFVGRDPGVLKYPPRPSDYDRNVNCEWLLRPKREPSCDRMTVTVEYVDTEKDRDILEIVDPSTNRVLARLSGPALHSEWSLSSTGKEYQGYPRQYVACSAYMTIRFKSDSNRIRGRGFRIVYTTHST